MYVIMVATECSPVAKVGGLADVVYGLAREVAVRGNAVEVILPKYDCMRYDHIYMLQPVYENLQVPYFGRNISCTVHFGFVHGVKCFFIDPHSNDNLFNRGLFYGHHDDPERFAFFCRAALEFMLRSGKHPDVIHCHDWQTGLLPVLLYDMYSMFGLRHPRVCYTLHNIKHQGVTGTGVLRAAGLLDEGYYLSQDRLGHSGGGRAVNLMKGGIVYSNFVTTVSPNYAFEVRTSGQSYGLGHTLHVHQSKFGGVINGIDYEAWNPELDPHIPVKYSASDFGGKYANKRALRDRLLLQDAFMPIACYVGRLDHQKGLDLIVHALFYCLANGTQFVLLGSSPEPGVNDYFYSLKRTLNDNPLCHIEVGFNEELAHLIYAGSDMLVMPSLFEPCGLSQLIAMRYGTVPIARDVGGIHDTVQDADYAHAPYEERTGYLFRDFNAGGLESALHRAIGMWYAYPEHFRELALNGMRRDFSWNRPGQDYVNIYTHIMEK